MLGNIYSSTQYSASVDNIILECFEVILELKT